MTVTIFAAMTPKGPTTFKMTEAYRRMYCPHWKTIEGTSEVTTREALEGRCSMVLYDSPTLWPKTVRVSHQEEFPIATWAELFDGFTFAKPWRAVFGSIQKILEHALNPFTGGLVLQFATKGAKRLDMWVYDGTFNLIMGNHHLEVFKREKVSTEQMEPPVVEPKNGTERDFVENSLLYMLEVMHYVGPSAGCGDGYTFESPNFGTVTEPADEAKARQKPVKQQPGKALDTVKPGELQGA